MATDVSFLSRSYKLAAQLYQSSANAPRAAGTRQQS